jgi:adenine-specific DNA glycosylase
LPRLAKKKPPAPISGAAGLLVRDGWLLVARRRPGGLLGGLWEPVRVGLDGGLEPREALRAAFLAAAGLEVRVGRLLGEVRHTFSHRQLSLWVHAVEGAGEPVAGGDYDAVSWRRHGEVEGLSTLARKVTALTVPADQLSLLAADGDSPVRG